MFALSVFIFLYCLLNVLDSAGATKCTIYRLRSTICLNIKINMETMTIPQSNLHLTTIPLRHGSTSKDLVTDLPEVKVVASSQAWISHPG